MKEKMVIKLGKKNPKEINIPNVDLLVEHPYCESINLYANSNSKVKGFKQMSGIGIVTRICKGDKFDIVYMRFGVHKPSRKIIVVHNHPRRQIMTLKKGHLANVYGYARYYVFEVENNGRKVAQESMVLYALGFQDWYIPRTIEIKRDYAKNNQDIEKVNESDSKWVESFLDQFDVTKGEDDE